MAIFFKLRCFEQETTNKIMIVCSIFVALLGAVHWGCILFAI
jgi:hypothetical protein